MRAHARKNLVVILFGVFIAALVAKDVAMASAFAAGQEEPVDQGRQQSEESDQAPRDSAKPTPLSIQPLDQTKYPEDRPSWVDELPTFDSENEAIADWPVSSGPAVTAEIANEVLEAQMHGAFEAYAERMLGREAAIALLRESHTGLEDAMVSDRYEGTLQLGNETFYEAAAMLKFDKRDAKMLREAWIARQRGQRMPWLLSGVGAFFAFCTLGTLISRRLTKSLRSENG